MQTPGRSSCKGCPSRSAHLASLSAVSMPPDISRDKIVLRGWGMAWLHSVRAPCSPPQCQRSRADVQHPGAVPRHAVALSIHASKLPVADPQAASPAS
eukprot:3711495-Amphidinium_carterae.1